MSYHSGYFPNMISTFSSQSLCKFYSFWLECFSFLHMHSSLPYLLLKWYLISKAFSDTLLKIAALFQWSIPLLCIIFFHSIYNHLIYNILYFLLSGSLFASHSLECTLNEGKDFFSLSLCLLCLAWHLTCSKGFSGFAYNQPIWISDLGFYLEGSSHLSCWEDSGLWRSSRVQSF